MGIDERYSELATDLTRIVQISLSSLIKRVTKEPAGRQALNFISLLEKLHFFAAFGAEFGAAGNCGAAFWATL